jgi:hypothetical protein
MASGAAVALGTGILAAGTATLHYTWLWQGIGIGLAAAIALFGLAEVRLYGLLAVHARIFRPLARRRAGWLLPAQESALHLVRLLDGLHRARGTCRHPRRRSNFLRWMDNLIKYLQWELPRAIADLHLGVAITADAHTRTDQVVGRLLRWHVCLVHDHMLEEYDRVCAEAATLTMALARGDWTWVNAEDRTPARTRLAARVAKRLVPSAVLFAAAIGLPYLPGVAASATGLAGIQVGLGLAAVLSLIPMEATHREDVMAAFASATKRNP